MVPLDPKRFSRSSGRPSGTGPEAIGGDSWASYSDLIAGVLLVFIFVTALKDTQIEKLRDRISEPVAELQGWKRALDQLCADQELLGKGLRLDCDTGVIELPDRLLFDNASKQLKPEGQTLLRDVVPLVLGKLRNQSAIWRRVKIEVRGHTDPRTATGEDPYLVNLGLSAQRAENVLLFMASDHGFSDLDKADIRDRSVASGAAFTEPPQDCETLSEKECYERMRRVELRLVLDDQEIRSNLLELLGKLLNATATQESAEDAAE